MTSKPYIFVFDVESTELFGTGFAVGAIVMDKSGNEIDRFELVSKEGIQNACDWVVENVIPVIKDMPRCETDLELRNRFYEFYQKHKENCEIWADCGFPVETNFLAAVAADDYENRKWEMPYPLMDLSTMMDVNIDRISTSGVIDLIPHNPVDDAKASSYHILFKKKQA